MTFQVVDLVLETGQRGRVFSTPGNLPVDLLRDFESRFIEEDDKERIPLLEEALRKPEVLVEVFPGEENPTAYYAYVVTPHANLFACVLASPRVVVDLIRYPPHVVFETAAFQLQEGETVEALQSWARRVWPGIRLGDITIKSEPR